MRRYQLLLVALWALGTFAGLAHAQTASPLSREHGENTVAPDPLRVVVVDTAGYGEADGLGPILTERVRRLVASRGSDGHSVSSREDTVAAANAIGATYPLSPRDLYRLSQELRADVALFPRVWNENGHTVIELIAGSVWSPGPQNERETLEAIVTPEATTAIDTAIDSLLGRVLASIQTDRATRREAFLRNTRRLTLRDLDPGPVREPDARIPETSEILGSVRASQTVQRTHWYVALSSESVFGLTNDFFYNHLIALRGGYRISRDFGLGFYVAYANVRSKNEERVNNVLFMAELDNRVRLTSHLGGSRLSLDIPLRFAIGYLPYNGAVVKLSAGLALGLDETWEIAANILAPGFWGIPGRTVVSLDLGIELGARF